MLTLHLKSFIRGVTATLFLPSNIITNPRHRCGKTPTLMNASISALSSIQIILFADNLWRWQMVGKHLISRGPCDTHGRRFLSLFGHAELVTLQSWNHKPTCNKAARPSRTVASADCKALFMAAQSITWFVVFILRQPRAVKVCFTKLIGLSVVKLAISHPEWTAAQYGTSQFEPSGWRE